MAPHSREVGQRMRRKEVGVDSDDGIIREGIWRRYAREDRASIRYAFWSCGSTGKKEAPEVEKIILLAGFDYETMELVNIIHVL